MREVFSVLCSRRVLNFIGLFLLGFMLLFSMHLFLPFLIQQKQAERRQASGKIIIASPGNDLSSMARQLKAGDTLILNDGIYQNQGLIIQGINGTATSPITIKAANDGKAIIDGGGTTTPVYIGNSSKSTSYIIIQGLAARNSNSGVITIYGNDPAGQSTGAVHDITLQRITGYNASSDNHSVFSVDFGSTNVLVEDCAAWGRGRYKFLAYHSNNVTFRRDWAYWGPGTTFPNAPRSSFGVYGSSNVILENVIGTHVIPDKQSTDYFTAAWQTSDGPATNNIKYLGVMFFDNWDGLVNGSSGQNTHIINSYFENNREQGPYMTSQDHGDGIMWASPQSGSITNSTFVNNEVGFSRRAGSLTISNSVFVNNGTAIIGAQGHSHLAFWQNGRIGTTIDSTDQQIDPGYAVKKYGRGAYLFVPPYSPLNHAGQGGTDIGANIIYRYQNGVLTNQPLWPWPMEDRIRAEIGISVTWANAGGIWKTLDGVYS